MFEESWKQVVVAVAFMTLITAIMVTAITRYDVDGALRVWGALGPLVGVLTGVVIARYFGEKN